MIWGLLVVWLICGFFGHLLFVRFMFKDIVWLYTNGDKLFSLAMNFLFGPFGLIAGCITNTDLFIPQKFKEWLGKEVK